MKNYLIAYKHVDGTDLSGVPWLLDDFNDKDEAIEKMEELKREGYQDVTVLECGSKIPEVITWDYVAQHAC